jgi:DNA helicase-2/ATP-dependent DNA helicase PcrA
LEEQKLDTLHFTPDRIAHAISSAKNRMITAERFQPQPGHPLDAIVAKVYVHYQARLLKSSAVDFDDLLLHVAQLLRENPEVRQMLDARYRYILVDEYQDTNLVQYAIVRALSIDYPNLAVTGDPDQSIYGWRGANIKNILNFESDYPNVKVVRLEQNWRSTKRILRVADSLIKHNQQRKPKELFTDNDEGEQVRLIAYDNQTVEAESIAAQIAEQIRGGRRRASDFAIFYRVNALSRALEFALRDQGVPFHLVRGLEFYQRKEIKDMLGFLQLINNPNDDVALLRVINTPPRGIGKTTINRIREHAGRYGLTLLDAARECGLIEKLNKRAATTVMKFVAMTDRLREKALAPVEEILGHVLEESGYQQSLVDSDVEEDIERLANIQELLTDARQFDEQNPGDGHLEAYLERASLVNDTDAWDA